MKRCWRTDRNGKRERPRLYRRSRLNLKVVGGACNCCRFAKMIKIHSFRATTSELLRSSFAGSISQQPAPISIYPDMDRMMHIGWPGPGCTRCSLSTMALWRASSWRPTGLTTLLLLMWRMRLRRLWAALGGYELSGLLWAGSAGSGLALAALAALGGSGLSWAGYGRLWAALLEREILALWKNQKRQILAVWKNPFLALWKNNSRPP